MAVRTEIAIICGVGYARVPNKLWSNEIDCITGVPRRLRFMLWERSCRAQYSKMGGVRCKER